MINQLERRKFFWGCVLVGGILFVLHGLFPGPGISHRPYPRAVLVGDQAYTLEMAVTEEQQARGLGERSALCATCAMLFVFEKPDRYAFWMKGMRFPLDIIWLSDSGTVVHVEHRITPESQEVYHPGAAASQVLEFNAGVLDAVRSGDTLLFSFP